MGANVGWSFGTNGEYEAIAAGLRTASMAQCTGLAASLRAGMSLSDAHRAAFPAVLRGVYDRWIHENWFGERPMWFGDSELTPGQIHEVMRESRARLAELLAAGATLKDIYIGCGHRRAHTLITWDGATPADAELTADGVRWTPADAQGRSVTMWVMVPFNTGYHGPVMYDRYEEAPPFPPRYPPDDVPAEQAGALARELLRRHVRRVTRQLEAHGVVVDPDGRVPAAAEPLRRCLLNAIPVGDLLYISRWLPRNEAMFRRTVLGLFGDGVPQPGRHGLRVLFDATVVTPPALPPGVPPSDAEVRGIELPPLRVGPGITITWV